MPSSTCCGRKARQNLVVGTQLRFGSLLRCSECGQQWYEGGERMLYNSDRRPLAKVSADRASLILEWDAAPITLSAENEAVLDGIGPNPPGPYSKVVTHRSYPCRVLTTNGVWHEHSVVSKTADAPYESRFTWRLGSEIERIDVSPSALPLELRMHMGTCGETNPGNFPCHIAVSDSEYISVNLSSAGYDYFLTIPGYRTNDFRGITNLADVAMGSTRLHIRPEKVTPTRFIVDGELWHPADYD